MGEKALLAYPSRLVVETTTRCNLACAACPRQSEGMASGDWGDMGEDVFRALEPAFPHLDSLVLSGLGEPLLHPGLELFIRLARRSMPASGQIGFQTNGLLVDRERALGLLDAGLDRACVSLDSLDPELFRGIRAGGELGAASASVEALGRAARDAGRGDFFLGIEVVARKSNLEELPDLVRWAAMKGARFVVVSQLLPYGREALAEAAYDASLDLARELLGRYRAEGQARGVDIGRYPEVFMRYDKDPEEREIVSLVTRMQDEAQARGISLNVERLLRLDPGLAERARAAFGAAAEEAAARGLDISLPAVAPRSARECEFVEGGSAFVSRSGEIHPCYFLWHRYDCFAGGFEKRVAPRSFGSLAEKGILELWNERAFAAFRANVLRYEYPYCLNCNLALCDYVQLPEFEQDCHMNAEPCAACLWCTGLFRCMF
ncbi:MAG TPA: radical SAM/SPASM family putative metalloenzyme maturase [Spirochaetales bacterium]|nr:radical SAM/SPASM family putative metalloenzyme maturase [Spirochaetales bacterium]HRY56173.1 radical SAM/SPASM family putative metalloenzyme maturase [Spirochaetia bacterium]